MVVPIEEINLRDLYDRTVSAVPSAEHSEEGFMESLNEALMEDPLRNSGLRRELSLVGMDYRILRTYPLNDFMYGIRNYLSKRGIDRVQAMLLARDEIADDGEISWRPLSRPLNS